MSRGVSAIALPQGAGAPGWHGRLPSLWLHIPRHTPRRARGRWRSPKITTLWLSSTRVTGLSMWYRILSRALAPTAICARAHHHSPLSTRSACNHAPSTPGPPAALSSARRALPQVLTKADSLAPRQLAQSYTLIEADLSAAGCVGDWNGPQPHRPPCGARLRSPRGAAILRWQRATCR